MDPRRRFPLILPACCGVQIFYSMFAAPLTAIIADRTPVERRGVFSALGRAGIYIGVLLGVRVASRFAAGPLRGFPALALSCTVPATPLALGLRRDSRLLPRGDKRNTVRPQHFLHRRAQGARRLFR